MIEKLYTVEEVAELAAVTGRTIRNYLKSGRLVGRKIGGQWRFPESEVQRLLTGADTAVEDAVEASSDFDEQSSTIAAEPQRPEEISPPEPETPVRAEPVAPPASNYTNYNQPAPLPTPAAPPERPAPSTPVAEVPPPEIPAASYEGPAYVSPEAAAPAYVAPTAPQAAQPTDPNQHPNAYYAPPVQQQPAYDRPAPAPAPQAASYYKEATPAPAPAPAPEAQRPQAAQYNAQKQYSPQPHPEPAPMPAYQPSAPVPTHPESNYPAYDPYSPAGHPSAYAPAPPPTDAPPTHGAGYPPEGYAPQHDTQNRGYSPPPGTQAYPAGAPGAPVYPQGYPADPTQPLYFPNLYGQVIPMPYYTGSVPPQAAPQPESSIPPISEAPLVKDVPAEKEKPAPEPTPTKEEIVTPEAATAAAAPLLSDIGKKVFNYIAEVHDYSQGPQICAVIDMHQSLATARKTSEQLNDIALLESEAGVLCQSFVEFDERYYVARYTIFGTSNFLVRCIKLIG